MHLSLILDVNSFLDVPDCDDVVLQSPTTNILLSINILLHTSLYVIFLYLGAYSNQSNINAYML